MPSTLELPQWGTGGSQEDVYPLPEWVRFRGFDPHPHDLGVGLAIDCNVDYNVVCIHMSPCIIGAVRGDSDLASSQETKETQANSCPQHNAVPSTWLSVPHPPEYQQDIRGYR